MDEAKVCQKQKLGVTQSKINLRLLSDGGKIVKVLSLAVTPCVKSIDAQTASARMECEVVANGAVFLDNGSLVNVSSSTMTTLTFENSAITPDSVILAKPSIYENVTLQVSNGEVAASAIVNCDVYNDTCMSFTCDSPEENVYLKEFDYECNFIRDKGKYNFMASKSLPEGELVMNSFRAIVKNVEPKNDYFVVNGEIVLTTVSVLNNLIKTDTSVVPFSEEVSVQGMTSQDVVVAWAGACSEGVVTMVEGGNNIDMPIYVDYQVVGRTTTTCISDAYSTSNELKLTTTSLSQTVYNGELYYDETVVSDINVSDFEPSVDKVIGAVGENINILNAYYQNGEIVVEGIGSVNVIYMGEQDDNEINSSFLADLPFTFNLNAQDIDGADIIIPSIVFGEVTAKTRKGQLEIIANVKVSLIIGNNTVEGLITNISYGETKPDPDCALEIVVAQENETLWDIAKRLNVVTEDLIAQNTDVTLPLAGGEKLVVYRNR